MWFSWGRGTRTVGVTSRETGEWQHPTTVTQTQVWGQERGETPPTPFKKGFRIQREPEFSPHRDVGQAINSEGSGNAHTNPPPFS